MALPALWTEATLIAAVEDELESVSADLGLLDLDVISTAVTRDVPALLGVGSVADVTYTGVAQVITVLAAARWKGWQKAHAVASVKFDLKAGSADLKQSQMFAQIAMMMALAESDYYTAVAAEQAASGTLTGFVFATVPGYRGW